jgi:integrase/recombinase XerC
MPFTPPHLPKTRSRLNTNNSSSKLVSSEGKNVVDLTSRLYGSAFEDAILSDESNSVNSKKINSGTSNHLPTFRLENLRNEWLAASGRAQQSTRTIQEKKNYSDKLLWFVHAQNYDRIGPREIEAFLDHLSFGHLAPNGRFDNGNSDPRAKVALRPVTVKTYFVYLKGFFSYLVSREEIPFSPFDRIETPKANSDQIQPFTIDQIHALLRAAKDSNVPARNVAILMFLLDTGARASEMCSLSLGDVDFSDDQVLHVRVLGKGNKRRTLRLSPTTTSAIWRYFKTEHGMERFYKKKDSSKRRRVNNNTPLFITSHHAFRGGHLTRSGLTQIIHDLGDAAGIGAVRCSPHTFRHTFAINFLRSGGDIFTLRDMLGHSSLSMVQRYLALAQSDMEAQHAKYSPVERMIGYR